MENKILSYRDLEVWKNGVKLAKDIIELRKLFPSPAQIFICEETAQVNTCASKKVKPCAGKEVKFH